MAIPITSMIEKTYDKYFLSGIIYGAQNVGKTHFLASALEYGKTTPVLIITCDSKDPTIKKIRKEASSNISVIDIPKRVLKSNSNSIIEVMESIVSSLEASSIGGGSNNTERFKFVGFDGLSKLIQPFLYAEIVRDECEKDNSRHDPHLPMQQDYKRATYLVIDWVTRLKAASAKKGFHLVFTAREKEESLETDDYDGLLVVPDLPPELRRLVLHELDFCFRLRCSSTMAKSNTGKGSVRTRVRKLYTVERDGLVVKDKSLCVPDKMLEPTVKRVYESFCEDLNFEEVEDQNSNIKVEQSSEDNVPENSVDSTYSTELESSEVLA